MFKTEEAKRFFAAWQALRKEAALPHYRQVFQDLPHEFLPQGLILEQVYDAKNLDLYMVRFMGTRVAEYWNLDVTGNDIFALMAPKVATAGRRNMASVLSHPCGLITVGLFSIASRDELAIETVTVPAANEPGRPARILGFVQDLRAPFPLADDRPDVAERQWLDIGMGVPAKKPAA